MVHEGVKQQPQKQPNLLLKHKEPFRDRPSLESQSFNLYLLSATGHIVHPGLTDIGVWGAPPHKTLAQVRMRVKTTFFHAGELIKSQFYMESKSIYVT